MNTSNPHLHSVPAQEENGIGASMRKLYKKVDATSKTRFYSSRRLKRHARFSGYVIAGVSLVLIFISLMQSYGLGSSTESPYVVLIQVFSSVLILCYSLSIEKNNYSGRAEKLYSCGAALGKLKVKMTPFLEKLHATEERYQNFHDDYHNILARYEAEAVDDFRVDYLKARLDMPEDYEYTLEEKNQEVWRIRRGMLANFAHYYVILLIAVLILCWIASPATL